MSPKAGERAEQILSCLQQSGSVDVEDLCRVLKASPATIRRDLQALEKRGLLLRTHGGATLLEPLLYEPFRHDSSFQEQIGRRADEKRRIAAAAAEMVEDGDTIAITAGTTATEVVRAIRNRRGVTVVTNTVNVAMELSKRSDIEVLVTGGYLRGDWFSLVGHYATHTMSQVFVNKAFLGVNGIDAERGLTSGNPGEAAVNRIIVQQAQRKIVVADHSKLGLTAPHLFCPAGEIDLLITDKGASEAALAAFTSKGIEVRTV